MNDLDQQLRDLFSEKAATVGPPPPLPDDLRVVSATRWWRRRPQWLLVPAAAVVTATVVIAVAVVSQNNAVTQPAAPASSAWTFDLYFVVMPGINSTEQPTLVSEPVTVPNTGDQPLDIVNALIGSVAEDEGTNGFNFSSEGQYPIAKVNSVSLDSDVIVVDLDRTVWDPYPNIDCFCPPGDMVMQQLAWTLNQALDTTLPVLLTINGQPARGIWFHKLNGPVSMEPVVSEPASVSTTLECDNNLRSTGTPDYGIPADPNTEEPLDQAARFVEGTGIRRDYPDVEIVLAEEQPTAQVIALVSNDKSVGILRYENDDTLGWHLASTAQCSPKR